ncbi:MAG: hypothetical protein HZA48_04735 [Planctomycetes bacterium]|nr:hypothetical protein [Planctomycetota bacterium]
MSAITYIEQICKFMDIRKKDNCIYIYYLPFFFCEQVIIVDMDNLPNIEVKKMDEFSVYRVINNALGPLDEIRLKTDKSCNEVIVKKLAVEKMELGKVVNLVVNEKIKEKVFGLQLDGINVEL